MAKINKALLSVSDKTGIVDFARELSIYKVQFISTGGTAHILRDSGLELMDVSDYTGYPDLMDGRVKTLHPKIHGGLLGTRSNPEHLHEMNQYNIECIDMIVVNLRPLGRMASGPGCSIEHIMNDIDIGGVALIRSAAKNFEDVTVVVDPADYGTVIDDMRGQGGAVSRDLNIRLAAKAFEATSRYDTLISEHIQQQSSFINEERYIEIPR